MNQSLSLFRSLMCALGNLATSGWEVYVRAKKYNPAGATDIPNCKKQQSHMACAIGSV